MTATPASNQPAPDPDKGNVIHLPSSGGRCGGFVTITWKGVPITVQFYPAKMRLILLLNEALRSDIQAGKPPETCGWRSVENLRPFLNNPTQLEQSVRRTIYDINRAFRKAVAKRLPGKKAPRLIETKRSIGLRLLCPFFLESPGAHEAR